jgi:hypothetical protein
MKRRSATLTRVFRRFSASLAKSKYVLQVGHCTVEYVFKSKIGPVLNYVNTTQWRQMEEWMYKVEVEVEVNLRPTVSRPVCLGVRRPSGNFDQFFFLLEISFRQLHVCYFVAPSLTRGRVSNLLYNCFWALSEQSLLGRSPAELTAIFYCLIWDSPTLEGQVPWFP